MMKESFVNFIRTLDQVSHYGEINDGPKFGVVRSIKDDSTIPLIDILRSDMLKYLYFESPIKYYFNTAELDIKKLRPVLYIPCSYENFEHHIEIFFKHIGIENLLFVVNFDKMSFTYYMRTFIMKDIYQKGNEEKLEMMRKDFEMDVYSLFQ